MWQHQVAGVSRQPRSCSCWESEKQEVGTSPATRVFGEKMKVCGELTEHGEVVFHSNVVDKRDQLARRLITQVSASYVLERCVASEVEIA